MIKLGSQEVTKVMKGAEEVSGVYRGTDEVWSAGGGAGPIEDISEVFSTYLYEGTETSIEHKIQNGIDLAGEGGLVWIKKRDNKVADANHALYDTERGNQQLASNSANAEAVGDIASYDSDGFTFNASTGLNSDYLGSEYVSWTFRKATQFFDVVTYTGDSNDLTLSHNLGVEPGIIIIKNVSEANRDWYVYHKSLGHTKSLTLNSDSKEAGSSAMVSPPTDKTFTLKGGQGATCGYPYEYVAYLFAHDDSDESMIKCGSYTGTGNDLSIELGFEPQWMLFKRSDGALTDWVIRDSIRGTTDDFRSELYPNSSDAEYNHPSGTLVFTPNGFRLPIQNGLYNTPGDTFIYMAIRKPDTP